MITDMIRALLLVLYTLFLLSYSVPKHTVEGPCSLLSLSGTICLSEPAVYLANGCVLLSTTFVQDNVACSINHHAGVPSSSSLDPWSPAHHGTGHLFESTFFQIWTLLYQPVCVVLLSPPDRGSVVPLK